MLRFDKKLEFLFQDLKNTHGRDFNFYVKILHRLYGLQKYIGYASTIFFTKIFMQLTVYMAMVALLFLYRNFLAFGGKSSAIDFCMQMHTLHAQMHAEMCNSTVVPLCCVSMCLFICVLAGNSKQKMYLRQIFAFASCCYYYLPLSYHPYLLKYTLSKSFN